MLCWWSNKHNLRKKMSYNKESFVQTSLGFVVRIKRQKGIEFNIFILQIFSFSPLLHQWTSKWDFSTIKNPRHILKRELMSHDHILVSATMKTMNGENTQEAVVTVTFVILSGHFDIVNIYFSAIHSL